jgi:hypothetical protein
MGVMGVMGVMRVMFVIAPAVERTRCRPVLRCHGHVTSSFAQQPQPQLPTARAGRIGGGTDATATGV